MKNFIQETILAASFVAGLLAVEFLGLKWALYSGLLAFGGLFCAKAGLLFLSRIVLIDAPAPNSALTPDFTSTNASSSVCYDSGLDEDKKYSTLSEMSYPSNVIQLIPKQGRR